MTSMRTAVRGITRAFEGVLRDLNILYREGGLRADVALIAFDWERPNIAHARAQAEMLVALDRDAAAACVAFARSGAALINLRLHPRERIGWIQAGIRATDQLREPGMQARLLNDLGLCYAVLGEFGQATECYQAVLALCQDGDDAGALGATFGNLANLHLRNGKPREAIELLNKVVSLSRQSENERREADALNSLGAAFKDCGDYPRAIDYHEQSLALHRKIEDRRGEGAALVNLGVTYRKSGHPRRAIEYYEEALPVLRSIRDERDESDALWNMSLALHELGDAQTAIECARGALAIRERLEDPRAAKVRERLQRWEAAAAHTVETPSSGSAGAQTEAEGSVRLTQAYVRYAKHYLETLERIEQLFLTSSGALEAFGLERANIEKAQRWAAANAEADIAASGLCCAYPNAGAHVLDLRLPAQLRFEWRQAAMQAARKLGRRDAEGVHLGAMGAAAADLGDQRSAMGYQKRRIAIARELGDRRGEANGLGNLAQSYTDVGKPRRALPLHQRALKIVRELGDRRSESAVLCNLGNAHYALRELGEAESFYREALQIGRALRDGRAESRALSNLGLVYADLGETSKAVDSMEEALAIDRRISDLQAESIDVGNLGYCLVDLGHLDQAVQLYDRHLQIAKDIGDAKGEAVALWNKSLAIYELGRTDEAVHLAERAVLLFETIMHPMAGKAREQLGVWLAGPRTTSS